VIFHACLYQKNGFSCLAESSISAVLYFIARRRFRAADAIDLQHIEKAKAERFTEFIRLFFI